MARTLAILCFALGLTGGAGVGLWQARETEARLDARAAEDRARMQAAVEQLRTSVDALKAELDRDTAVAASERNDIRARLQDLSLAVEDLRIASQPLVAEIPELPIAPQ